MIASSTRPAISYMAASTNQPHGQGGIEMRKKLPGAALVLVGAVWLLEGIGVLPYGFMAGQVFWAVAGGVCLVAGLALVVRGFR